jgi:hypothetical protein
MASRIIIDSCWAPAHGSTKKRTFVFVLGRVVREVHVDAGSNNGRLAKPLQTSDDDYGKRREKGGRGDAQVHRESDTRQESA